MGRKAEEHIRMEAEVHPELYRPGEGRVGWRQMVNPLEQNRHDKFQNLHKAINWKDIETTRSRQVYKFFIMALLSLRKVSSHIHPSQI
jgi:hypothetical protein